MNSLLTFLTEQIGLHLTKLDATVFIISIILAIAAKPIIQWLSHGRQDDSQSQTRIRVMRVLNVLIILSIIIKTFFSAGLDASWLEKIIHVLIVIYFAVLSAQIMHFFLLKRFGKSRNLGEKITKTDSYSSRALSLFSGSFIAIIAAVGILNIIGLESWLQAGGVFGIIGIFLAMTQSSWAPDIIGGLIILNSKRCEEGDIVQFYDNGSPITKKLM